MIRTLFLPGAGGSAGFWRPVAERLALEGVFLSWPGLGEEPPEPGIKGIDDLVTRALAEVTAPVNIVAQSMGGYIALKLALARPHLVNRLVLCVTSGGVPVADLGGSDWRTDYFAAYPSAARWIGDPVEDLSPRLGAVRAPALLLWGDADPISPVAVGRRLHALLPDARLHILPGADHDLARTFPDAVAGEIRRHLSDMETPLSAR
ncbi:MAG: alpha/beta hydrolase [Xanthobacter sp. 17-67-6]|nr:MAG: alpha/beta hydrolase [Xanthobacter sp. 17-67-6]